MSKKYFTTKEVLKETGLRLSQLQYLRNDGIIQSVRRGAGYPTLYPPETVNIIKTRLAKLNAE